MSCRKAWSTAFRVRSSLAGIRGRPAPAPEPAFLAGVLPFAQASHSGSVSALWRVDDRSEWVTLPVVVFGDEGGAHVVARSLRERLRLLSYDAEMVVADDECFMLRDEDDRVSGGHAAYVAGLQREVGVEPVDDPEPIIARAQAELGEQFVA
jgi:hypothetical protein